MKIYSWNVNGIRSSYSKGLGEWIDNTNPDILCLQEIKAKTPQFPEGLRNNNYHLYINEAQKPGYSGVAVFSKEKPLSVDSKLGSERFDNEGRLLKLDFKDFTLVNLYLPHGGRQKENLGYKLDVYYQLFEYLKKITKPLIICGDLNIAHTEMDLARPKNNLNNIMFTPEERKQLDHLESLGFSDTFRIFNKENGNYTWWPYMASARERNLGWRIDYIFSSDAFKDKIRSAFICTEVLGSDHCPIGIEI